MTTPTEFEAAVLTWIAAHTEDAALRNQLTNVQVIERNWTGAGCYSKLAVPSDAPRADTNRGPVDGPIFDSGIAKVHGGALLWLDEGRAADLEIYTFVAKFPSDQAELGEFVLHEFRPSR